MRTPPTIDDLNAAAARLKPVAAHTPLLESLRLNEITQARVLLKAENLQRVGAFKFRGAYNAVSRTDSTLYPGGVVACSSGNHAQGIAAAAKLCGLPATIVMPKDAPRLKVERTKSYGAEVILYDRAHEDRDAIAAAESKSRNAAFIHPFDNPHVMAGQGTVGLEIATQARALNAAPDTVLVCTAGGGLLSGIAIAMAAEFPDARVHSVEPEGFDDFARSLAAGTRVKNEQRSGSICDALLVETPGELTFAVAKNLCSAGLVVSDDMARSAVRFAFQELKLVLEPGGAVALAALLSGVIDTKGKTIVAILSGGNADPVMFAETITQPS